MYRTAYRTVDVDGLPVFYGEASLRDAPTILLLHGKYHRSFGYIHNPFTERTPVPAPATPGPPPILLIAVGTDAWSRLRTR